MEQGPCHEAGERQAPVQAELADEAGGNSEKLCALRVFSPSAATWLACKDAALV